MFICTVICCIITPLIDQIPSLFVLVFTYCSALGYVYLGHEYYCILFMCGLTFGVLDGISSLLSPFMYSMARFTRTICTCKIR